MSQSKQRSVGPPVCLDLPQNAAQGPKPAGRLPVRLSAACRGRSGPSRLKHAPRRLARPEPARSGSFSDSPGWFWWASRAPLSGCSSRFKSFQRDRSSNPRPRRTRRRARCHRRRFRPVSRKRRRPTPTARPIRAPESWAAAPTGRPASLRANTHLLWKTSSAIPCRRSSRSKRARDAEAASSSPLRPSSRIGTSWPATSR